MQFEWDLEKNRRNWRKHGVSFEEATQVFAVPDALELFDDLHSDLEDRFITIGPIERGLIMVVWTERDDDMTRVVSARFATPTERRRYHRHLEHHR